MLSMTGSTTGPNAMDIGPRYAGIILADLRQLSKNSLVILST
jgi:hypothetical protein